MGGRIAFRLNRNANQSKHRCRGECDLNRGHTRVDTRVVAIRLRVRLSYADEERHVVPFYGQLTLGGNDDLRAFARYRYYDNNYLIANVEHRWYAFTGMDVALFADAGTVAPTRHEVDFSNMRYGGGIGLRFRLQNSIIMRIDFAYGTRARASCGRSATSSKLGRSANKGKA